MTTRNTEADRFFSMQSILIFPEAVHKRVLRRRQRAARKVKTDRIKQHPADRLLLVDRDIAGQEIRADLLFARLDLLEHRDHAFLAFAEPCIDIRLRNAALIIAQKAVVDRACVLRPEIHHLDIHIPDFFK